MSISITFIIIFYLVFVSYSDTLSTKKTRESVEHTSNEKRSQSEEIIDSYETSLQNEARLKFGTSHQSVKRCDNKSCNGKSTWQRVLAPFYYKL